MRFRFRSRRPDQPASKSDRPERVLMMAGLVGLGLLTACAPQQKGTPPWMQQGTAAPAPTTTQASNPAPAAQSGLPDGGLPAVGIADPAFQTDPAPPPYAGAGYQPYWWGSQQQAQPAMNLQTSTGEILPIPLPSVPQKADGVVRIGLLVPLSGSAAPVGASLQRAAQMALFDFSQGGIELLVQDTAGTAEGAQRAAGRAIADGADIIIGPLLASNAQAIKPLVGAAGLRALSLTNDRSAVGEGVYSLGFAPSDQIDRVIGYAISRGLTRIAVLAPEDPYGITVMNAAFEAVQRYGGQLTRSRYFDVFSDDHTEVIKDLADFNTRKAALERQRAALRRAGDQVSRRALKRLEGLQTYGDLDYDALLVADGGQRLIRIAALLPYYDIDPKQVQILGTGQWDVAGLGTEPALLGAWYAAPDPTARSGFVASYRQVFGQEPHRLATLAYDAAALVTVLAQSPGGPRFDDTSLQDQGGFTGRDGIFRFTPSGYAERGLAVLEVANPGNRLVEQAPATFPSDIPVN
ncbi:MAG: penicillin-binding protein activator [Magnetovibrionaceae bacterium]